MDINHWTTYVLMLSHLKFDSFYKHYKEINVPKLQRKWGGLPGEEKV